MTAVEKLIALGLSVGSEVMVAYSGSGRWLSAVITASGEETVLVRLKENPGIEMHVVYAENIREVEKPVTMKEMYELLRVIYPKRDDSDASFAYNNRAAGLKLLQRFERVNMLMSWQNDGGTT